MLGVGSFDAVTNASGAAILAVGPGRSRVAGERVPKRDISGTLCVDHRVADGASSPAGLWAAIPGWGLLL
jgi:pyruvate/2-oxoglutarate dehydrogenase complex dihydrolipoamide acyltransferase (E2) component